MKEYIPREDVLRYIAEDCRKTRAHLGLYRDNKAVQIDICRIPAADVAPVVHAEWKINADGYYPYCSACKKEPPGRCMTAHCPNCGAKMDGGEQDA